MLSLAKVVVLKIVTREIMKKTKLFVMELAKLLPNSNWPSFPSIQFHVSHNTQGASTSYQFSSHEHGKNKSTLLNITN